MPKVVRENSRNQTGVRNHEVFVANCEAQRWPKIKKKISLDRKLQADSKNGV